MLSPIMDKLDSDKMTFYIDYFCTTYIGDDETGPDFNKIVNFIQTVWFKRSIRLFGWRFVIFKKADEDRKRSTSEWKTTRAMTSQRHKRSTNS